MYLEVVVKYGDRKWKFGPGIPDSVVKTLGDILKKQGGSLELTVEVRKGAIEDYVQGRRIWIPVGDTSISDLLLGLLNYVKNKKIPLNHLAICATYTAQVSRELLGNGKSIERVTKKVYIEIKGTTKYGYSIKISGPGIDYEREVKGIDDVREVIKMFYKGREEILPL